MFSKVFNINVPEIRDPVKTYSGSLIQGSKRPRIRIRNTACRIIIYMGTHKTLGFLDCLLLYIVHILWLRGPRWRPGLCLVWDSAQVLAHLTAGHQHRQRARSSPGYLKFFFQRTILVFVKLKKKLTLLLIKRKNIVECRIVHDCKVAMIPTIPFRVNFRYMSCRFWWYPPCHVFSTMLALEISIGSHFWNFSLFLHFFKHEGIWVTDRHVQHLPMILQGNHIHAVGCCCDLHYYLCELVIGNGTDKIWSSAISFWT